MIDETHDPSLRSWVAAANDPASDFPIQNLPFGVFRGVGEAAHAGVAIGDQILDLAAAGLYDGHDLNALMARGRGAAHAIRTQASQLLRTGTTPAPKLLVPMEAVEMLLPAAIGDYTDFYASIHHATNVGSMFRPDNPLLPNYKWVPIGYHGRASSIVISGTPVRRPSGQTRDGEGPPVFGPSRRLDYELEVGVFVGAGNPRAEAVAIGAAESHVFGLCLVNDWSARDIQTWEYQPLGPFLAKSFATTVSPWVVTLDALAPYRAAAFMRGAGDPEPLPYLSSLDDTNSGGIAITLEVMVASAQMRQRGVAPLRVSRGSFTEMYWTIAQLLTHHASNGCNLRPGDLLASGTVSGPTKESRGCLLERTWRGTEPLELPTGETRAFLQDGDEVIMRAWCEAPGRPRVGFGECRGVVTA
ncbi:MAG TPA: fumarylacetoacetase [Gemmatimonadaceae bacterium]|nr:fumarylacetoacetase [Gemmatimonadaceae bacterium]